MSRCEHGEMISIYCLNDTCTWRQAGGCQNCFKRYHNHPANVGTVTQDKLDEFYKKMIIRPDPKPKSRILQEAVYNYFIIMKSLISTSIDTVSRNITNRLNFPYLSQSGQLETFNKIKNKEYKKINKKQLKIFYDFANQNSKEQLQQKEKQIYAEEVESLKQSIKSINQAFVSYAQAIKGFDETFHLENTFVDKINQIACSISGLLKDGKMSTGPRSDASSKSKDLKVEQVKAEMNQLKRPPIPRDRDRKISFDLSSDISAFKVNLQAKHENQLNERKKRLLQMDNTPKIYGNDQIRINLVPNGSQEQRKDKIIEKSAEKYMPRELSEDKISTKAESHKRYSKQHSDSQIDPRLKIAHNALPRQVSKPKLYQHSNDIKEKKFTIPVKINEQKAQCSSPLLKKKKTLNQNQNQSRGLNLFKVESMHKQQNQLESPEQIEIKSTPVTQQKEPSLMLKQKQTDSLALLIKSLSVSAEEAIPFLEASLKYAHNNLSAAEYLSYLYLEIGKPRQCLTVCNQFLEQMQDSCEANEFSQHLMNNKAAALNMLGRYSESISILQKCIQKKPKEIYYKNLADAYFSIGINEKAVLNYEKAIKLNPELDQAHFNLAVCQYSQGHFNQAQISAQKALKLNLTNQQYQQLNNQLCAKLNI